MSDEQAPESDRARDPRIRPAFLPPLDGSARPAPAPVADPPPAAPDGSGAGWNAGVLAAGALLLVSAFLPWVEARVIIDLFGRRLTRDAGTVAGLEADNVAVAVPVLAMAAIAMAFWGVVGRDTRVSALAALPGVLSLLVCALFVLRLDDMTERLATDDLPVGYEVSVVGGWYLAVAMSLLITAFALARPLIRRLTARRREADRAGRADQVSRVDQS
jgi:hypothetical protein